MPFKVQPRVSLKPAAGPVAYIYNVLVVEDDLQLADWLAEVLTYENCTVDLASNGIEALDRLCSASYDALVCDIMMPRFDGEALYHEVAKRYPYLANRFLFITGSPTVQAGMANFATRSGNLLLTKPLEIEAIRRALQDLCAR